jgi:hypothetical protein
MTKRKKRKGKADEEVTEVVGVAWYAPEQWERLREISADVHNLEDTYKEWKASAENALKTMSASGAVAYKVAVDVEELLKWCNSKNRPVDGAARSEFAWEKLMEELEESE